MTTTNWFLHTALAILATASTIQAADKIRYEEIPSHLGPFGSVLAYRGFTVVTLDGKEHNGRRLRLEPDHVRIFHLNNTFEDLTSDRISRIEISQAGRFFHHIATSAELPLAIGGLACGDWDAGGGGTSPVCMIPITALASPIWAYTAATAPFYLASDAVAFFIPPKVYEIVH